MTGETEVGHMSGDLIWDFPPCLSVIISDYLQIGAQHSDLGA